MTCLEPLSFVVLKVIVEPFYPPPSMPLQILDECLRNNIRKVCVSIYNHSLSITKGIFTRKTSKRESFSFLNNSSRWMEIKLEITFSSQGLQKNPTFYLCWISVLLILFSSHRHPYLHILTLSIDFQIRATGSHFSRHVSTVQ
ncbi:hypothetical protein IGI44_002607 [Enterococcus sp. DIV0756]